MLGEKAALLSPIPSQLSLMLIQNNIHETSVQRSCKSQVKNKNTPTSIIIPKITPT